MKCPDDYRVVMMPFPGDVLACVRIDANGYPTVYINDYLSLEAKRKALRHELSHFHNGDFHNHFTIYDIEKRASYTLEMSSMPRSFRALTEDEALRLDQLGLSLMQDAFGPFPCTDPLEMPYPLFDRAPPPPINTGKRKVW